MPAALGCSRSSERAGSVGNLAPASLRIIGCGIVIGMGEKETTLKELGEMLAYVVEHMVTKEELLEVKSELKMMSILYAKSLGIFGMRRGRISEKSSQNLQTFGAMSRN